MSGTIFFNYAGGYATLLCRRIPEGLKRSRAAILIGFWCVFCVKWSRKPILNGMEGYLHLPLLMPCSFAAQLGRAEETGQPAPPTQTK
jgi:hypothetical protein